MHGPRIKASFGYYATKVICAVVNQFDYLLKKRLVYMVIHSHPHVYHFFWVKDDGKHRRLIWGNWFNKALNTYVSPWLKVKNE